MSRELRDTLGEKLMGFPRIPRNLKASVLLVYALGYIDDTAFRFITGLDSFNMDEERDANA